MIRDICQNRTIPNRALFRMAFILLILIGISGYSEATEKFQSPQDISFTAASDGSIEKYVLLLPQNFNNETSHSLMIALHGHGSDRWQFATGTIAESRAARDVALKYNMIYISPDYRAKTSWMGPKAETDLIQIISELKETYRIDRVILVGASMGGSSSLTFTAIHPELIQGVASLNGTANHLVYENFQEAIQASFGGSKKDLPEEYKRRSAEYWSENFTMPVAITTGGKDTAVPPDSTTRLAQVVKILNPNVLHIHRPDTGHTTSYEDSLAAYEFVCKHALTQD